MDILDMIELISIMVVIAVTSYKLGYVNGYDKGLCETERLLLSQDWVPNTKPRR